MSTRRRKRLLKLPRLEKPTAMQISVIVKSVRIRKCLVSSNLRSQAIPVPREERYLEARFGEEYARYKAERPALVLG
jgi:protein-S-isoprenylcysteine O-methyltransferase Ste14